MIYKISLLALFTLLLSCSQFQKPLAEKVNPKVNFLIGDVNINGGPAKSGYQIQNGDIVETGSQSYLEAHFGKQSAVRIREESKVIFNITDNIVLDVQNGSVLNILEKRSRYLVKTPSAVAAIRGTIFFTNILDEHNTYFCACNGTIAIEDNNGKALNQLSSAHHMPNIYSLENGEVGIQQAGMQDHTDLEIFEFMYRLDQATKE